MNKFKKLSDIDTSEYSSIDNIMPLKSGTYKCVLHGGSMSPYYYEAEMRYSSGHRGFNRRDWDYVIMWKDKE